MNWIQYHWIWFWRSNSLSYQTMSWIDSQNQLCAATPISSVSSVLTFYFGFCLRQVQHLLEAKSRTCNHVSSGWIDTYGIHHWRSFRSSYIELTCVVVEPTATKFRLDALTNWTLRPLVQLTHTSNFVQLLQFHLFVHCSRFILVFPFVRHHICFKPSLALRIRLVAE